MNSVLTNDPGEAAEFIARGGVVAFPTETVYGLGANVFDEAAIAKIFAAKNRPADNPLIAHVADRSAVALLAERIPAIAERLIDAFFPGALTIVLPKRAEVPLIATAGLATIGVRQPLATLAHEFLRRCPAPIVAPSANLSGKPSPTTWQAVAEDLDGRIDCILKGEATLIGLESTVVDCTGDVPLLLRRGGVSLEELRRVIPQTEFYSPQGDEAVRSPGLRHRHYSPRARVRVLGTDEMPADAATSAWIGLAGTVDEGFAKACRVRDAVDYAHRLFDFFRACDAERIATIYCGKIEEEGIGAAVMDRVRRAAE